jgi:hypothetical protein
MVVSLSPFTISWKASKNDARGKHPSKLCIDVSVTARQGIAGHQTRPFP